MRPPDTKASLLCCELVACQEFPPPHSSLLGMALCSVGASLGGLVRAQGTDLLVPGPHKGGIHAWSPVG